MKNRNSIKSVSIIILFLLISFSIIYKANIKANDFQENLPVMNIIETKNNIEYRAILGDGNWMSISPPSGNILGNGYIVDINKEFSHNCPFIEANSREKLKFDIDYEKLISNVSLYTFDISCNKKEIYPLLVDNPYSFTCPEETGNYYYILNVLWDENHNFDYLFKIKVI